MGIDFITLALAKKYIDENSGNDGANGKFVSYDKKQTLTDEQRAQARANIAKYQYKWYTAKYTIFKNVVADYGINVNNTSTLDCELANNITSVKLSSASALGSLAFFAKTTINGALSGATLASNISATIAEYEAIKAAGALTGDALYLCYQVDGEDVGLALAIVPEQNNGNYTHTIEVLVDNVDNVDGYIYWNNDTQEYENHIARKNVDTTLSKPHFYADAKAVGDALAQKIDKSEIATDDEIIEMLIQEDVLPVVADSDGALLSDENSNILLW